MKTISVKFTPGDKVLAAIGNKCVHATINKLLTTAVGTTYFCWEIDGVLHDRELFETKEACEEYLKSYPT